MTVPYAPPLFTNPVVNAKAGGFILPVPYISLSQYDYAPTAMDISSLKVGGTAEQQQQVLYDLIRRASGWADRYIFGTATGAKGASLCASQTVDDGLYFPLKGSWNLQCRYSPIITLDGCAVGPNPAAVQGINEGVAQQAVFGTRTISIPAVFPQPSPLLSPGALVGVRGPSGKSYVVWTYTSGYAHLRLAADAAIGDDQIVVEPNGPAGSLLGVLPGTPMSIDDWGNTEDINVAGVVGTTIMLDSPLQNEHVVPSSPDFTPVTALPADVIQAVIYLTTALIKTRGDAAIELASLEEPKVVEKDTDNVREDIVQAFGLLNPFRMVANYRN